jgi:hypothetical protein
MIIDYDLWSSKNFIFIVKYFNKFLKLGNSDTDNFDILSIPNSDFSFSSEYS